MNDIEKHKPIAMAICRAVEDDDEIVEQEWINYLDQARLARIVVLDELIKEANSNINNHSVIAFWLEQQKESL